MMVIIWQKKSKRRRLKFRQILLVILIAVIVVGTFQKVGELLGRVSAADFGGYLSTYLSAPIRNLDYYINNVMGRSFSRPDVWGKMTFVRMINFLGGFLKIDSWVYELDLPFLRSNGYVCGNVYTTFYAYLYDFGVTGVIVLMILGGIYYQTMMLANGISDTKVHLAIKIISNYLYSFHMPAFFALSGCLFWNQIKQNRWTLSSLIGKKFKRLILPLFGTWFFWNIPIKYISGYYLGVPFSKVLLQLIFPNRVYLWYLESLFLVFVIVYITIKLIHNNSWRLIILLLMYTGGIVLQYYANDYIPFGNPMRYCIWFYLGKQIECITDKIRKQRWVTCSILIFDIGLFFVFRHVQETLPIFIIRDFALALMGIAIAFILSDQIGSIASKYPLALKKISERSMDVYLYSEPLNYLILSSVYSILGIASFGIEWVSFGIIILRFFGTFIAAFYIGEFIANIKQKLQIKKEHSC